MENPFALKGKNVLITGASSGIGRVTAIECAKLGARLIITGRNPQKLDDTFNSLTDNEHSKIVADLTNKEDLKKLVSAINSVDGVVLCAGIGKILPFQFCTREDFNEIFEINFFSQVELLRLLYKKKLISKSGSVVIVSSIAGNYRTTAGNCIYGASKNAIDTIMHFCAKEFGPARNIRVNCVCPGMIETPFIGKGTISDVQYEEDKKKIPLKRYGLPREVAFGIIYLLSDASSYVSGHDLIIDGGTTV